MRNLRLAIKTSAKTNPRLSRLSQCRSAVFGKTKNCKLSMINDPNALLANHQIACDQSVTITTTTTKLTNHFLIGATTNGVVIVIAPLDYLDCKRNRSQADSDDSW